jgi:hypothetical protein
MLLALFVDIICCRKKTVSDLERTKPMEINGETQKKEIDEEGYHHGL